MIRKLVLYVFLLVVVASCDYFEYHPYDIPHVGSGYRNLNKKNLERIAAMDQSGDTIRFVFMGDTQRFYDETKAFVKHVNRRTDVDFVIHGGDLTDFGMTKEYIWVHDIMKKLTVPYVAIVGNHDLVGHGKEVYEDVYGDFNFAFVFRGTRFIMLNTNALEFDYATPVPDFDFMLQFIEDQPEVQQTVVAMHAEPFSEQFNNNSRLMFNHIVPQYKNTLFCLHAHAHRLMENDFFNNGIIYYGCEAMEDRSYMLFTLTKGSYEYEVIKY